MSQLCLCLQVDADIALRYQKVMAEWKACEVIVKQREKESHSATLAKFSSGSSIDSHVQRLIHRDSTISNDVGTPFPLTTCSAFAEVQPWGAETAVSTAPESWAEIRAVLSPVRMKSRSEFWIIYLDNLIWIISCSCLRGSKVHL